MTDHGAQNARNVLQLFDAHMLWGKPLPRTFADRHVRMNKHESFDDWWKSINEKLAETEALVEPPSSSKPKKQTALTYATQASGISRLITGKPSLSAG